MGLDAYTSLFVGTVITHEDFWTDTIQKGIQPECSNGHPGPDGKFCSDCGKKIGIQETTITSPTAAFQAYCNLNNLKPEKVWPSDWTPANMVAEYYDSNPFGEFTIRCVDAIDSYDGQNYALGIEVHKTKLLRRGSQEDDERTDMKTANQGELTQLFAMVKHIQDELGLTRDYVSIFLCSNLSS